MFNTEDIGITTAEGPNTDNLKRSPIRLRLSSNETIVAEIMNIFTINLGATGVMVLQINDITNPQQPKERNITATAVVEWVDNPAKRK